MRDGRRKRLGLGGTTTATLNAGEDPGNISTSGLGSLLVNSNLLQQAVNEGIIDTNTATSNNFGGRLLTEAGPQTLNVDPNKYFDTRDQRYLNDAYNYYLGGGKGGGIDAAQIPGAIDTLVDVGDGGENIATSGLGLGDTAPANTDFEQNLIDQGVGVQGAIGDPVVAPAEMPDTQETFDDYNFYGPNREYGEEMDVGYGEGQVDPNLAAAVGGKDTTPIAPTITGPTGDVYAVDDPLAEEKIDFTPETQGIIDQAFSKVGSTASDIMNDLSQIPGAVVDFANQTVDVLGKKINIGSTLLKAGINRIVGGPISLVFDAVSALAGMLPEGGRGDVSDALGEKYGMDDIGRLTGGPMEGYSVGPAHAQTVQDRIDSIENRTAPQTKASIQKIAELKAYKAEVIGAGSSGVITDAGDVLGPGEFLPEGEDLVTAEELAEQQFQDEIDAGIQAADDDSGSDMLGDGPAPAPDYGPHSTPAPAPTPAPISVPVPAHISGGGGGGGGGGWGTRDESGWGNSPFNKGGIVSLKNAKK